MTDQEITQRANEICVRHGTKLKAEILEGVRSVGVGGDQRSYTPVVNVRGPFPGHDTLASISSEISNTLPINRVTYEVTD